MGPHFPGRTLQGLDDTGPSWCSNTLWCSHDWLIWSPWQQVTRQELAWSVDSLNRMQKVMECMVYFGNLCLITWHAHQKNVSLAKLNRQCFDEPRQLHWISRAKVRVSVTFKVKPFFGLNGRKFRLWNGSRRLFFQQP